jgi:hypothetical protein
MFRCYLTNFGFYLQDDKDDLEEAIAYGKSKGFDFTVYRDDEPVCSWSYFGGLRRYGN